MTILYLPFIPCVMERKNDCFFVCRIAQVSQGKHWDSFAKKTVNVHNLLWGQLLLGLNPRVFIAKLVHDSKIIYYIQMLFNSSFF
jgi:hypothetical protein